MYTSMSTLFPGCTQIECYYNNMSMDKPSVLPPPTVHVHSPLGPQSHRLLLRRGETFPDSLPETAWPTLVDNPVNVAERRTNGFFFFTCNRNVHLYIVIITVRFCYLKEQHSKTGHLTMASFLRVSLLVLSSLALSYASLLLPTSLSLSW